MFLPHSSNGQLNVNRNISNRTYRLKHRMSKAIDYIPKFFSFSYTMPPKANGKLSAWNKEMEKRYEKDLQDRLLLSADEEWLCQGIQNSLFELP